MDKPVDGAEALAREQFIGWIADRFIQRHRPDLARSEALRMAGATLGEMEHEAGPFGHPDHDWSEDAAHSMANEEIDTCWENAQ